MYDEMYVVPMTHLKGIKTTTQVTLANPDKCAERSRVGPEAFRIAYTPKPLDDMYVSWTREANHACQRS